MIVQITSGVLAKADGVTKIHLALSVVVVGGDGLSLESTKSRIGSMVRDIEEIVVETRKSGE